MAILEAGSGLLSKKNGEERFSFQKCSGGCLGFTSVCHQLNSQRSLLKSSCQTFLFSSHKMVPRDVPGGAAVKNLPANAKDTGSSPRPGRSHVLQSNKPVCHNY